MKNISTLINTNIKNNFNAKTVAVIWYGFAILLVVAMIALFGILLIAPELDKISPDKTKLDIYLSVILFSASLLGLGINLNALGFSSMVKEKSRGNIQSLLATPLKLKEIWLGKSLAIFISGLILCELLTLITLIAVNYIYFVPTIGFLFNPWIAVNCFIVFPALYLCLGLLVYLIGLTGKPTNANIIALVFLPLFVNIVIQLPLRSNFMDFTSWPFTLVNIGITLVIAIIVVILQSRISKEKVVLSY
jgi:ABC-type transport system involved in multi-copper enzyme maturation permease subunit